MQIEDAMISYVHYTFDSVIEASPETDRRLSTDYSIVHKSSFEYAIVNVHRDEIRTMNRGKLATVESFEVSIEIIDGNADAGDRLRRLV